MTIIIIWLLIGFIPCIFYMRYDYKNGRDIVLKDLTYSLLASLFGPILHIVLLSEFLESKYGQKIWEYKIFKHKK